MADYQTKSAADRKQVNMNEAYGLAASPHCDHIDGGGRYPDQLLGHFQLGAAAHHLSNATSIGALSKPTKIESSLKLFPASNGEFMECSQLL